MTLYPASHNILMDIMDACAQREEDVEAVVDLNSYFRPLSAVPCFKCLGLVMLSSDDDWMSVIQNLLRARQKWVCLYRVFGWEGGGWGVCGLWECFTPQWFKRFSSMGWSHGFPPMDWEGAGRISPSGHMAADGEDVTSERGGDVDLP